jgi:hypothetical protein
MIVFFIVLVTCTCSRQVRHPWLGWELPCEWNLHRNMFFRALHPSASTTTSSTDQHLRTATRAATDRSAYACAGHQPAVFHFGRGSNIRDGDFVPDQWFAYSMLPVALVAFCPASMTAPAHERERVLLPGVAALFDT